MKRLSPINRFYQGYGLPSCKLQVDYLEFIASLPNTDSPEVFGLHKNADITYQINTARSIFDTILSMQPKEGAQMGGETRETIVGRQAKDMLNKLPPDYIPHEVNPKII
ncbi:hypothetical protein Avbf_08194 [Armadillidium vulgare]|nr:hypothetical protein Avbf_08194 [Armadillidium vulgare]